MPRRRAAPRLYLDGKRKVWVIRDGASFVRTGCAESDRSGAEKRLAEYNGQKHQPERGQNPLIADVLLVYAREHLPHTKAVANSTYNISSLAKWWGARTVRDVSARTCREFASGRSGAAARRDLEVLRAAIRFWHREYGPLDALPSVTLPPKPQSRDRWLTRSEAARLLYAARRTEHLKRFILIGLYTGSRSGPILQLKWDWVDVERGIMQRRAPGEQETRKRRPPVRVGRRLLSFLRRWKRQDLEGRPPTVVHYDGFAVRKLRRSWGAAAKRAGLADVTPHTLRHTRATWLMRAGIDPWEAAGALGMSIEMLERTYGHHHPDFQKRAAEV
jgi:integrase